MLEEIRLYNTKGDAQQATKLKLEQQKYEVKSHSEITNDSNILQYDLCIRIVDNEGSIVQKAAKALYVINLLVSNKISDHIIIPEVKYYQEQYNTKYNFNIKVKDLDFNKYNQAIDFENNLNNIFQHHVAKHLYTIFDFKPLERKVLAPMQKGERNTIKVYPSATGIKTAEYSVQEGDEYRKLQYNTRKGYNDEAIFRSEMNNQDIKDILQKKIISHIITSLIPFKSLKMGYPYNEVQEGMKKVFTSFVELIENDYLSARSKDTDGTEIKLDNIWISTINEEYKKQTDTILNVSGVSSEAAEENYI